MNSKDYWLRRFIREKAVSIKSQQRYEEEVNKRLNQLLYIYDKDLKAWYRRFSYDLNIPKDETASILKDIEYKHFTMTLKEFKEKAIEGGHEKELNSEYFKSQIARLNQLEAQLKQQATQLFSVEKLKFQDEMINQFDHTYLHDTYNIQSYKGKFDANFATFDRNELRYVLSQPWIKDGEGKERNFSERIWGNYVDELPEQLMDSMLRNVLTGANYGKIQREFRQRFNGVKSKQIHRLVITEMGHVQEEASAQSYVQQDVEKYQYIATLENRTCSQCAELDLKVFNVKDRQTGLNYPVMHPHCRCTTVPYIAENDDVTDKRWTKQGTVDDLTFDEWRQKYAN